MTDAVAVVDARLEAGERVGGRFDVRVLEPSPPAITDPAFFADDPVLDDDGSGLPILAPVPLRDAASTWDELTRVEPDLADWCADRWLGAWRALAAPTDVDALVATRESWHRLAEHVVAPARFHSNGKIGLRFTRGGCGTPFFGADEQVRIAVDGLILVRDGAVSAFPITTVQAAADAVGIAPGAPAEVYAPTTPLEPDAALTSDPDSARFLGDWFGFGASVLEALRAGASNGDAPARVQLWPEHFDLSVDLGNEALGQRATFGVSPGDAAHPLPYVYVSPWTGQRGDFWNEGTFGSLGFETFVGASDQRQAVLDYFAGARVLLPEVGHPSKP